jgi:chromatin segregation and condensation protein Rec8/ScpA/Scc1 (kleisin family)
MTTAKQKIAKAEVKARDVISLAERKAKFVTQEQHAEVISRIEEFSARANLAAEQAAAAAQVSYKASVDAQTYNDSFKNSLEEIKVQVYKTNGSVKDLQLWKENAKGWIKGFGVSLVLIMALVAFIFNTLNNDELKTQNLLQSHITETK